MVSATTPLPARLELVVTDINTSFLASFRHRDLRKAVVREGLLVKVSAETLHYTCYLHCNYVIFTVIMYFNVGTSLRHCRVCESDYSIDELYAPLVAAVNGRQTGPGTLGTIMLCECLLTLLFSWQLVDQPTNVLTKNMRWSRSFIAGGNHWLTVSTSTIGASTPATLTVRVYDMQSQYTGV